MSTKTTWSSLFLSLYFSCSILNANIGSVVNLPGLNPNWLSAIFGISLKLASIVLSHSFIVWLISLIPLPLLHSSTHPLPLNIGTLLLFLQSFGILFVLRMLLNAFTMHSGLYFNLTWTASIGSPSGPQAFPFPIFAICFFTSSNEKHSTGPSVVGNSYSCSLGFSALKSLSNFCFHLPLIFPDPVKMVLSSYLTLFYVRYISTSSVSAFGKLVYYLCSFSGIQFSVQLLIII